MSDPYEFSPPFVSPLTHDEHATLGRIAILWGQIDMMLDQLLQSSLGLTGQQRLVLIGEKPIGVKLDMLKNSMDMIEDREAKASVLRFWELANQTKTQRNKCFHGVWGFRCGNRENNVVAAASHFKSIDDPVKASDLPALEKKLCKTARCGARAMYKLNEFKPAGVVRLFHGKGEGPAWLPKWREQHPLDDDSLDKRHKAGQLPWLSDPLK